MKAFEGVGLADLQAHDSHFTGCVCNCVTAARALLRHVSCLLLFCRSPLVLTVLDVAGPAGDRVRGKSLVLFGWLRRFCVPHMGNLDARPLAACRCAGTSGTRGLQATA
jgi:hypothetical protein